MPINRTSVAALTLSTILAIAYGAYSSSLYEGAPPFIVGTVFKASSIVILGAIAIWTAGASPAGADIGRLERAPPGAQAGRRLALPPSNKLR